MRSSANFLTVFSESQNANPLDAELGVTPLEFRDEPYLANIRIFELYIADQSASKCAIRNGKCKNILGVGMTSPSNSHTGCTLPDIPSRCLGASIFMFLA